MRAELYEALVAERRGFLGDHADAREGWRAGNRGVSFPAGTYLMRKLHGASVAAAYPDAILCAPDVVGEIARPNMDVVSALVREAHAEHTFELTDIADGAATASSAASAEGEDDRADDGDAEDAPARGSRTAPSRPPPETTPLISPGDTADTEHPTRLVTLRNRRDRDPP